MSSKPVSAADADGISSIDLLMAEISCAEGCYYFGEGWTDSSSSYNELA